MSAFLPTIILRHRKENLKKCSLRGLEQREDMCFYTYPTCTLPSLENYVTLYLDDHAPQPLSQEDACYGLFLLDSTWNYEVVMHQSIKRQNKLLYRALPPYFVTAYPRKQTSCPDPERGLATVEALYIAYQILQRDSAGLLDGYYWKEEFLTKNAAAFALLEQSQQQVLKQ